MQNKLFVVLLLCVLAFTVGCSKTPAANQKRVEAPIAQQKSATATPGLPSWPKLPPPSDEEVASAVQRVFGNAVALDPHPQFITGDFNGDWSQDLAVVVHVPASQLSEVNSEFANWSVADPQHAFIPPAGARVVKFPAARIEKLTPGEQVLAIIHGFEAQGWRNPAARQAYLLRHVAGERFSLRAIGPYDLPRTAIIQHSQGIEELLDGRDGLLYWTGSNYMWRSAT